MLRQRLTHSLFLSSMMRNTNGAYCARCGKGADMVQLGALLVAAPGEYMEVRDKYPHAFLPNAIDEMTERLSSEVKEIRSLLGNVIIGVNAGIFDIQEGVKMVSALTAAGGDILELNVHGGLKPFADIGFFEGMALPEYRERLLLWTKELSYSELPLVIKFHTSSPVDFEKVLEELEPFPVFGYHFNIRNEETKGPDYEFIKRIRPLVKGMLFVSGYIRSPEDIKALWDLGVDSIGVATPILKDENFLWELSKKVM